MRSAEYGTRSRWLAVSEAVIRGISRRPATMMGVALPIGYQSLLTTYYLLLTACRSPRTEYADSGD